jgi:aminoglycoside phosphotransferase (APT) family kinase protein
MVSAATFVTVKPEAVTRTEHVLGATAESWSPVASRGYALGDRWVVRLRDGRTVFAKRAIDEPTADGLHAEHGVYAALSASFMPSLLGWEDGELPLLLLEDLSGEIWPPPWTPASIEAVLQTLAEVAATPAPPGLRMLASHPPATWDAVAQEPETFLGLGLCAEAWLADSLPALLEASRPAILAGDALLHFDVRSDNLCIRGDRAVLVDWNLACVGDPAFDVAFWLPSLTLEDGPQPDELASDEVNAFAATVAGFFAARAGQPPPPGAPTVRAFQLAQLEVALPWAARTLALPTPGARR